MKAYQTLFSAAMFLTGAILFSAPNNAAERIDFENQVKPILESRCLSCHGETKPKGDLVLTTRAAAIEGGENGPSIVPGDPEKSPLYTLTILPPDDIDIMPPKGDPLTKAETEVLRLWIEQGASWPENIVLSAVKPVDFVADIQPILELNCVSCHREGHADGGLRLDTRAAAFSGGDNGPAIIPGKAKASTLYLLTVLREDHEDLMPPVSKGGPLPMETTTLLRDWINQGAKWPEDIQLQARKVEEIVTGNIDLTRELHQIIMANSTVTDPAQMKPYASEIPGTGVEFEMVPIPGGEFTMGSPETEPGHKPDEAPQHRVQISPFWMGKFEVTWNEYELFMYPTEEKKIRQLLGRQAESDAVADAVSRPTTPYVEMSFGMGKDGYPAISMTQHAANMFCKWISAKTGHFYRLPTEAEWEYACRAGTSTPFYFGDNPALLDEYAWYTKNSDWKYQKVGTKKPNPWGLYDMHGNVSEWTLDQYDPNYYALFLDQIAQDPWNKATKPYPHAVRGGSWQDDPEMLRSANRIASDATWKIQDPQLPKSIWYHTDAQFLGFRVVRPLKTPTPEEMHAYWHSGLERD